MESLYIVKGLLNMQFVDLIAEFSDLVLHTRPLGWIVYAFGFIL